jgi:hypothetical protein
MNPTQTTLFNLKAARPAPAPAPPNRYQLVGYRGESPIVRVPGGQPFVAGQVETNGAIETGPIQTRQAGNDLRIDGVPRVKPKPQPVTTAKYGKLKILYRREGGLWIGGDRSNPIQLPDYFNINQVFGFNNYGEGDRYLIAARSNASSAIKVLVDGNEYDSPPGFESDYNVGMRINYDDDFLGVNEYKDNGLFINRFDRSHYWALDKFSETVMNSTIPFDPLNPPANGTVFPLSGNLYISPEVTKPYAEAISYQPAPGGGDSFVSLNFSNWLVSLADVGLTSTIVEHRSKAALNAPIISRKYIYRSGQLNLFGESITGSPNPSIDVFDSYPNWVGEALYSIKLGAQPGDGPGEIEIARNNRDSSKDREVTITVGDETPGYYSIFKRADAVQTKAWAIPEDAIVLAYSYNPN